MPDTLLAARIRNRRVECGFTQEALAEELRRIAWLNKAIRVGVTSNMISKWERGEKSLCRLYRELLCLVLDLEPADLRLPASLRHRFQWQAGVSGSQHAEQEHEDVDRRQFLRSSASL